MKIVIGDCKYRMAISAAEYLAKSYEVVVFSNGKGDVPCFYANNVKKFEGDILELGDEANKPVLLPIDVATIEMINSNREEFERKFKFLLASRETLDKLNDKAWVAKTARELGISTPREFDRDNCQYPAVIKYNCGEKLGKKAEERYKIIKSKQELDENYEKFAMIDGDSGTQKKPILQEYIEGRGIGVSILLGKNHEFLDYICHERRREYPITGGPSTLCVSRYLPELVARAVKLLQKAEFVGMAMVEFKGKADDYKLLEVNPRVWGTFPLVVKAKSSFLYQYCNFEKANLADINNPTYDLGVKMRFLFNDLAAGVNYIKNGQFGKGIGAFVDLFNFKIKDGVLEKGQKKQIERILKTL